MNSTKQINYAIVISSLLFSIYFQGRELFNFATSLIGFKPIWLTGIYNIALLILFTFVLLSNTECRKALFSFNIFDLPILLFFSIVLFEISFVGVSHSQNLPDYIIIYLIVYLYALFIGRSLLSSQLRLTMYITNIIAVISSFLITFQVANGTATFVQNGGRLINGLSDNPINVGYIGVYSLLSSLTLILTAKNVFRRFFLLIGILSGGITFFLSGTRSSFIFLILGIVMIFYSVICGSLKSNIKQKSRNFVSISVYTFIGIIAIYFLSYFSDLLNINQNLNYFKTIPIDSIWSRISQVFVIGTDRVTDQSIYARYQSYNYAINIFLKNPLKGGGFYASGHAHNAFLQVMGDYGIFGLLLFTLPFMHICFSWLSIVKRNLTYKHSYIKSEFWELDMFIGIILLEAICLLSFHGDPYRTFIPLCAIGIAIAYLKRGYS